MLGDGGDNDGLRAFWRADERRRPPILLPVTFIFVLLFIIYFGGGWGVINLLLSPIILFSFYINTL
jgi:hypothetical protein